MSATILCTTGPGRGLGGGIVPPLAADGGSNEGEESMEEDKPDNDEDQAGEVYVCLNFSYSEMLS